MKKYDNLTDVNYFLTPTTIKCANCNKKIMVKLSDFEKGKIITCSHCNFKMQVDDDYYKQAQDSVRDLKKSFSDLQKEINKSIK